MDSDNVKPDLRVKTNAKLGKTNGMTINKVHLVVRMPEVTGTVLNFVPGHGGDVWFIKHDNSEDVGAYCYDEFEPAV